MSKIEVIEREIELAKQELKKAEIEIESQKAFKMAEFERELKELRSSFSNDEIMSLIHEYFGLTYVGGPKNGALAKQYLSGQLKFEIEKF